MIRFTRRTALAALAVPAIARAQSAWPERPVRVMVAWPPGGSTDVTTRLVMGAVGPHLPQPVVIENRGGATGAVGSAAFANAAPDGYSWMVDASGQAVNQFLLPNLSFDYATAFSPVTQFVFLPTLLLVRSASPIQTLAQLVQHLRENPGKESYGSSGVGTASHLSGALLMRRAGLNAQHVPYRGGAQQIQSVLTGETLFTFSTIPTPAPLVRDGQLRVLGITMDRRSSAFPEAVPIAEQGYPGFNMADWNGLHAPHGTPPAIIARMAALCDEALKKPELQERFKQLGAEPAGGGPERFASFIAQERQRLGSFIRAEGIRAE